MADQLSTTCNETAKQVDFVIGEDEEALRKMKILKREEKEKRPAKTESVEGDRHATNCSKNVKLKKSDIKIVCECQNLKRKKRKLNTTMLKGPGEVPYLSLDMCSTLTEFDATWNNLFGSINRGKPSTTSKLSPTNVHDENPNSGTAVDVANATESFSDTSCGDINPLLEYLNKTIEDIDSRLRIQTSLSFCESLNESCWTMRSNSGTHELVGIPIPLPGDFIGSSSPSEEAATDSSVHAKCSACEEEFNDESSTLKESFCEFGPDEREESSIHPLFYNFQSVIECIYDFENEDIGKKEEMEKTQPSDESLQTICSIDECKFQTKTDMELVDAEAYNHENKNPVDKNAAEDSRSVGSRRGVTKTNQEQVPEREASESIANNNYNEEMSILGKGSIDKHKALKVKFVGGTDQYSLMVRSAPFVLTFLTFVFSSALILSNVTW